MTYDALQADMRNTIQVYTSPNLPASPINIDLAYCTDTGLSVSRWLTLDQARHLHARLGEAIAEVEAVVGEKETTTCATA